MRPWSGAVGKAAANGQHERNRPKAEAEKAKASSQEAEKEEVGELERQTSGMQMLCTLCTKGKRLYTHQDDLLIYPLELPFTRHQVQRSG